MTAWGREGWQRAEAAKDWCDKRAKKDE